MMLLLKKQQLLNLHVIFVEPYVRLFCFVLNCKPQLVSLVHFCFVHVCICMWCGCLCAEQDPPCWCRCLNFVVVLTYLSSLDPLVMQSMALHNIVCTDTMTLCNYLLQLLCIYISTKYETQYIPTWMYIMLTFTLLRFFTTEIHSLII